MKRHINDTHDIEKQIHDKNTTLNILWSFLAYSYTVF